MSLASWACTFVDAKCLRPVASPTLSPWLHFSHDMEPKLQARASPSVSSRPHRTVDPPLSLILTLTLTLALKLNVNPILQNSYDARYLVERLDVGSGAALAHSFKKNPLRKAKSSIAVIAHKLDDKVVSHPCFSKFSGQAKITDLDRGCPEPNAPCLASLNTQRLRLLI